MALDYISGEGDSYHYGRVIGGLGYQGAGKRLKGSTRGRQM